LPSKYTVLLAIRSPLRYDFGEFAGNEPQQEFRAGRTKNSREKKITAEFTGGPSFKMIITFKEFMTSTVIKMIIEIVNGHHLFSSKRHFIH